ncbi:MAG: NAD(P)-binding protein, partial [Acetobacteraceae bacterium]
MTTTSKELRIGRRAALTAAALAALAGASRPRAQGAVRTRARIVIVGAGAAGLAAANRLALRLDGAEITLLDSRRE